MTRHVSSIRLVRTAILNAEDHFKRNEEEFDRVIESENLDWEQKFHKCEYARKRADTSISDMSLALSYIESDFPKFYPQYREHADEVKAKIDSFIVRVNEKCLECLRENQKLFMEQDQNRRLETGSLF